MTSADVLTAYRASRAGKTVFLFLLLGAGVILVFIGLGIGPMKFSITDIAEALCNRFLGTSFSLSPSAQTVITEIRLPRIILALLSGFGLAVTGMQMQVIVRNPLASPFTLGVSAGAAFGAGLAIISGISLTGGASMLIGNAFVFSLIPCGVVFLLSRLGRGGYGMLILAGIAMNFIFSSLSTLLSYVSNSEQLKSLSLWLMGNLGRATWPDVLAVFLVLLVSIPLLFLQNQKLNVLNAGDESARGLGVHVERTRIVVLLVTSLIAAAIICFTGIIGFVGLVSPHIVRLLIGHDARYLMPASGLFGAVFLLGSDILALKVIEPAVLPVGIITSFIGGPMLLYLIIKNQRNRGW